MVAPRGQAHGLQQPHLWTQRGLSATVSRGRRDRPRRQCWSAFKRDKQVGQAAGDVTDMDQTSATTPPFAPTMDVLSAQRHLRRQLLDGPGVRHKPARDLAAHMLLHLDDLKTCWDVATHWLQASLQCQRVDTGFGRPDEKDYFPGYAEAKNGDYDVPSFGGVAVDNRDPIMQAMWSGSKPVIFADIKQDIRVTPGLRRRLSGAKTKSKFGSVLRTRSGSYGLICADWTEHFVPNEAGIFDCFEQTVTDVLSPIIAVSKEIHDAAVNDPSQDHTSPSLFHDGRPGSGALDALTRSEIEVARLVAQGSSYKEIARIRGRSLSTIDHQLRSIRGKLGVTSTANLVVFLLKTDGFTH